MEACVPSASMSMVMLFGEPAATVPVTWLSHEVVMGNPWADTCMARAFFTTGPNRAANLFNAIVFAVAPPGTLIFGAFCPKPPDAMFESETPAVITLRLVLTLAAVACAP